MKEILKIIIIFLFLITFGIIGNIIYFMWTPSGFIKNKKERISYSGNHKIHWGATLSDFDFWFDYLNDDDI